MYAEALRDPTVAVLRALAISEIEYSLDGSGDSGEVQLEHVVYQDGRFAHDLPPVPVTISSDGQVVRLDEALERIVADAPEGDWVNNEGGYGTVVVRPFAGDDELVVDCDIAYRDEEDYGDDEDEFDDNVADQGFDGFEDELSPDLPASEPEENAE